MNIKINPREIGGTVTPPPSKSLSHRAIIAASMAEGESTISNLIFSDDIIATIEALRSMGIAIEKGHDFIKVKGGTFENPEKTINCNESGSTLRFLIPFFVMFDGKVTFDGKGQLPVRPLDPYMEIFKVNPVDYVYDGKLPLTLQGKLESEVYEIDGKISSQFITGLMFVLPLMQMDSKIVITSELESISYVDMTIDILGKFGVEIINNDYKEFLIKGNQKYRAFDYEVESDFSQIAFWAVAGTISRDIELRNVDLSSKQGDKEILDLITRMGGKITETDEGIRIAKSQTEGIEIDASQIPDIVPILTVLASFSKGQTRIYNAERLRIKESDRLKAISTELNKLGAAVTETTDGLIIDGVEELSSGIVNSWKDHRIAMSLAIASCKASDAIVIEEFQAINKSYPTFLDDFISLGGDVIE